ncbi:hypothetical protein [uncultured Ruminococcus sp.]|uniref:hypothetical protein n=1 Tax=uncultured Ruminococcus sp. TaxID=165186 RepID=UPI00280560B3|nr:hypothetical protein [uncultured Ruminococcus sp.]
MMQTNETNFPEMLTIDQTAKRSGLSAYAVRKLARSSTGQAFTVRVGTKYLINQEKFAAFLNCEALGQDTPEPDRRQPSAGIQPVSVRL